MYSTASVCRYHSRIRTQIIKRRCSDHKKDKKKYIVLSSSEACYKIFRNTIWLFQQKYNWYLEVSVDRWAVFRRRGVSSIEGTVLSRQQELGPLEWDSYHYHPPGGGDTNIMWHSPDQLEGTSCRLSVSLLDSRNRGSVSILLGMKILEDSSSQMLDQIRF